MTTIEPHAAQLPLVLSIDVGTSSVRAILYDSLGRALQSAESRAAYQMTTTSDGGVEIDPDNLLGITLRVIDEASRVSGGVFGQVCSVAMCTFWHSVMGVGRDGLPVTSLYNWSDTRSREDARALGRQVGVAWIHSRTGTMPHSSYYPAKILWLRRTQPSLYNKVARWTSFGEYLYWRLFGRILCSVSIASGTGLFNPNTCDWDQEVLDAVAIGTEQLSPLAGQGESLHGLEGEYARRWPALSGVPWIPAYGDGASSNIGSGCVTDDLLAINLGTSGAMRICWKADRVNIPPGLWCYRADRRYFVMGGALSNGGDVGAWCHKNLRIEPAEVDKELGAMRPDGHGLTVLPFYSGERSTGWADDARASITGLTMGTWPIDILRANLEAVAYRFAAIYDLLKQEVPGDKRIIASGGALASFPAWTQIIADVLGSPVIASAVPEASSRGAAISALEALGFIGDLTGLAAPLNRVYEPDPTNYQRYLAARHRQEQLYDRLVGSKRP
jgi:gluconokinase